MTTWQRYLPPHGALCEAPTMDRAVDIDDVRQITGSDEMILWTLGNVGATRLEAWVSPLRDAVLVAGTNRSGHDRLGLWGAETSLVPLAQAVRRVVGKTYRPIGEPGLVDALVNADNNLVRVPPFCWMQTQLAPAGASADHDVVQLDESDDVLIRALLSEEFAGSHELPGIAGVECWIGIRNNLGGLDAVGALAWSTPDVGFLSGIAVRRPASGRGLGRAITDHLVALSLKQRPVAALMVDAHNKPAWRLYSSAGMSTRFLAAAHAR
ncbi:GNAT family N-acetyltransferase [Ilumatobacter sp.]|uniref:GNAT family N-acetyltransferase n=2 Tax=Ilumatobacter sp. TaxID=1967498 RepID=UPI003750A9B1